MTAVIASILALLATCGVLSAAPEETPDDRQPPNQTQEDQHFCCQSVDAKTFTGDGCVPISGEAQIAVCNKVLYCEGNWVKDDGKVTCE